MTIAQSSRWRLKPLDELAYVGAGNPAPQDKKLFEGGKYPFIRTSDVGQIRFGEISTAADLLNDQGVARLRLVPKGTVLMPKSGASTFLNHRVVTTAEAYVSSHLATITPRDGVTDPRYLLYALSQVSAQDLLPENSYPSLNLNLIKAINVPVPPLEEQQRLVAVLDDAFEGLARARAHTEANIQSAQELFSNQLGRVFASENEEWAQGTVGDLCSIKSGTTVPKSQEQDSGDIPYVKVGDMNLSENVEGIQTSSRFLNRADVSERKIIPSGATIFPKRGGAIMTNKKRKVLQDICADLNVMGVIPGEKIDEDFLFFFFESLDMRKIGSGSAIPQINNYDIAPLEFSYPTDKGKQKTVADELRVLAQQTSNLTDGYIRKLRNLDDLRQSLLQKAFAGELT